MNMQTVTDITRWSEVKHSVRNLRCADHRLAWSIALAADALQIGVFPLFAAGGVSPADTALDLIVAVLLTKVLGWHWAFLPSFATELLPGFDLFPTWTAAVYFVTRKNGESGGPEILPPQATR
jgi:hypothetical protein